MMPARITSHRPAHLHVRSRRLLKFMGIDRLVRRFGMISGGEVALTEVRALKTGADVGAEGVALDGVATIHPWVDAEDIVHLRQCTGAEGVVAAEVETWVPCTIVEAEVPMLWTCR